MLTPISQRAIDNALIQRTRISIPTLTHSTVEEVHKICKLKVALFINGCDTKTNAVGQVTKFLTFF